MNSQFNMTDNVTKKIVNGIALHIVKDYTALSNMAAEIILQKIKEKPKLSMLVPTGTTPEGLYKLLSQKDPALFREVTFFNFDEYCVKDNDSYAFIPETDERSYRYFMNHHILQNLPTITSYFPTLENREQEGVYDRFIQQKGGIDLCINAIGEDGHTFGFNLPGSSFESVTRLIQLNNDTKAVNETLTGLETPEYAISTGLKTGMSSKEVLLLVSGQRKAEILRKIVTEAVSPAIPAIILRTHPHCTWIIDEDAASLL